jgi:hypothetical protein
MLLIVAAIHFLPLPGVLGVDHVARLYGVSAADPNLSILMRHRAVLFAILGSLLAAAAFVPVLQPVAFVAGFMSVVSFLVIARRVGGYNAQVRRVYTADVVAVCCLMIGLAAYGYEAWRVR